MSFRQGGSMLRQTDSNFSQTEVGHLPRSLLNRPSQLKTTLDEGYLVPIYVDEIYPGDTVSMRATTFARLTTPVVPVMDNMYADVHWFFIPLRLLWENFQRFMGERDPDPDSSIDYLIPQIVAGASGFASNSLFDYLGVQVGAPNLSISAFFSRAYNRVYNEWYRDENLVDSVPLDLDNGPDAVADYVLRRRLKRHDYFTSCLPWPQKGDAVSLPLGTTAPVYGASFVNASANSGMHLQAFYGGVLETDVYLRSSAIVEGATPLFPSHSSSSPWTGQGAVNIAAKEHGTSNVYADLEAAIAPTVNDVRMAFAIQQMLERDARGGTRYIESVLAHFGVVNPDFRLQRTEYLGGGSTPITTTAIPQMSESGTTPQGNLAGVSTFSHGGSGFSKSFTEHGVLLGLVSIRADLTYQQGTDRMFFRRTRYDMYYPTFAHLGEQAVLNREIYTQGPGVLDPVTGEQIDQQAFGYQERYAELRYKPSKITGLMRSNVTAPNTSLDVWHLAQDFAAKPDLDDSFIEENAPVERVVAVEDEPHFRLDCAFGVRHARVLPVRGTPGLQRL